MKNIIITVVITLLTISAIQSQIRFGGGIETNFDGIGLAAKVNMDLNDQWGGQVGYNWYLNSPNPSRLDLDATYLLTTAGDSDEIMLKGIGGFNYWSSGVSGISSELGINIGANISFPISDNVFYLEPR